MNETEAQNSPNIYPEQQGNFSKEIERLFDELAERDDRLVRESLSRPRKQNEDSTEEGEKYIARRRKEYEGFCLDQKIAHITSNFL